MKTGMAGSPEYRPQWQPAPLCDKGGCKMSMEFPMASIKPPKKSETIEIRLSHEAKTAFMERCRRERLTASEAIRAFIDDRPDQCRGPARRGVSFWRIIVAGIAGAVLGLGAAAPSFAWAAQNTRTAFDQLDRNHDNVLNYQEFRSR
jgi:hypothetical protein